MVVLSNLRSRISCSLLALAWFGIYTSADKNIRVWLWLPEAGLVLWLLLQLLPGPEDAAKIEIPTSPVWRRSIKLTVSGEKVRRLLEQSLDAITVVAAVVECWAVSKVFPPIPQVDPKLAATVLMGMLAITFLVAMFIYVKMGQPIEVRSGWAGLGGSGGGVRASTPLVCLLAVIVFGGLAALLNVTQPATAKPPIPATTGQPTASSVAPASETTTSAVGPSGATMSHAVQSGVAPSAK